MPSDTSGTASDGSLLFRTSSAMNYLETISNANNLWDAFLNSRKGSQWKSSTQHCEANLLRTVCRLRQELRDGTYRQKPFVEFFLSERGKTRPIRSHHVTDRIVQRSLCDNALIPALSRYLIYDNGASLKHKGVSFSRKRLQVHLQKFLRNHTDGYVLLLDFSKFFDNIPHEQFLQRVQSCLGADTSLLPLLRHILASFSLDVSYMTDAEYDTYNSCAKPIDSITHRGHLAAYAGKRGSKILRKSMGIGSQISQIGGVFYPTVIDHYFKCVLGVQCYGRYMDDIYVIHEDKHFLQQALRRFMDAATALGLFVNPKKSHIVRLSHGFTFLKTRYSVNTGRVEAHADNITFVRERRRLKRYRRLLERKQLTRKMISNAYQSWRGTVRKHAHRWHNLQYTDGLYMRLFYYR